MVTHLLDTNIISYLMKARSPTIIDHLTALGPDRVAISVITAIELRQGADLHADSGKYHAAIDAVLAELPVLSLTGEVAPVAGRLRAALQKAGTPLGDLDSLIAAQAIANDLTLVTNDAGFHRVAGLHLENWV
jgi:tRNA(fMet)-specific endonuclease VapC